MATYDAFALGAAVARETKRAAIWLGPLSPAVRDPVSLALGVTSVSILGGRPANLAIGASTARVVRDWHGRRWGDNQALVEETIRWVRPLLAGERSPGGFRLRSPYPGSQVAVAAFGPAMEALANRVADRLVLNLLTPAQVAAFRARTTLPITVWVPAALEPGEEARAQVLRELKVYLAAPAYARMFEEAGLEEPSEIADAVSAMGALSEVRERVAAYHSAGATTVALVPVTAEDPGGSRLLGALGEDA